MKFIDISMPIHEDMTVYKNKDEKKPRIITTSNFSTGSAFESELHMNLHTGTHIDMPLHMIPDGAASDNFDISTLITVCTVLDLTHVTNKISDVDLRSKEIQQNEFVLLKTKNSFSESFNPEFIYLDTKGANYLKELKAKGVGIDALGIERSQPGHETHKILFQNNIIIIEGLRLSEVPEGIYKMIALPIKINNVEALPARVILTDNKKALF